MNLKDRLKLIERLNPRSKTMATKFSLSDLTKIIYGKDLKYFTSDERDTFLTDLQMLRRISVNDLKYLSQSSKERVKYGFLDLSKEEFEKRIDNLSNYQFDKKTETAEWLVDLLTYIIATESSRLSFTQLAFICKGNSFNIETFRDKNLKNPYIKILNDYKINFDIFGKIKKNTKNLYDLINQPNLKFEIFYSNIEDLIDIRSEIITDFKLNEKISKTIKFEEDLPDISKNKENISPEDRLKELKKETNLLLSRLICNLEERNSICNQIRDDEEKKSGKADVDKLIEIFLESSVKDLLSKTKGRVDIAIDAINRYKDVYKNK